MIRRLTEEQCKSAVRDGEFGGDVLGAATSVAVVLTQNWCPQWQMMKFYLNSLQETLGEAVFFVEYNQEPFFEEFLDYKENRLGNREIPYVRFYARGALTETCNFVSKDGFLRRLRGSKGIPSV